MTGAAASLMPLLMENGMRPSLLLAIPLGFVATSAAAAHPEDANLNAVYQRLAAARAAHSVEGMSAAFAPAGLLVDQRPGPVIAGSELPARLRPMAERLATDNVRISTAYRIERRSVIGDIALDAGFMRQQLQRPDGPPNIRYARFLVTLQRGADGAWRIIGDASMPATEEAWAALARTDGLQFDG
jgi:ketosteroid isomerase-like protein